MCSVSFPKDVRSAPPSLATDNATNISRPLRGPIRGNASQVLSPLRSGNVEQLHSSTPTSNYSSSRYCSRIGAVIGCKVAEAAFECPSVLFQRCFHCGRRTGKPTPFFTTLSNFCQFTTQRIGHSCRAYSSFLTRSSIPVSL